MKHSKMKKAMGLKGFMSSMSKPKMKKGGFPDLNKDGEITKADILMGRGVISKPKMQDGGKKKSNPLMTPAISLEERRTLDSSIKNSKVFPPKVKPSGVTKQTKLPMPLANSSSNYKKGQKGMNVMKETKKNATPSIPNSYYAMGGMKEENPLASMLKKKAMKKSPMKPAMKSGMKPKMAMGGMPPNAFGLGVQPLMASKYQGDTLMGQSLKKGGMIKKKKK